MCESLRNDARARAFNPCNVDVRAAKTKQAVTKPDDGKLTLTALPGVKTEKGLNLL